MNIRAAIITLSAIILLASLVPVGAMAARAAVVKEYREYSAELYTQEKEFARVALRRFRMDGTECYLAVNPDSLRTEIVPVGRYLVLKKYFTEIAARRRNTAYFKAIRFTGQNSWRLQNAGLIHVPANDRDVYVTVDLCPTSLPLDRSPFTGLVAEYGPCCRPVPVAVAVSGMWMEKHPEDLRWLTDLVRGGDLSVTWLNHTYNHRHKKRVPLWKNFLLDIGSRLEEEIMKNEIALIEVGLVPSVFFRFPGLVSNKALFGGVAGYGLITVGSDAWLGKKQWPAAGSIILVHANGQEPVGIKRFLWLLGNWKKDFAGGRRAFGDLKDGLRQAMKMY